MPLSQLGPYQLEKLLGRGGMGAVYAARHGQTGEPAAVKLLSGHLADDATFRERFKQEIETLKRLLHPNIVQLYGYGEQDGNLYYVMELIDGRSLQDELAAGRRFTWREVVRIGVAVAQALKHAHDRGIIHRDLKPANLLIDAQDHIKLTDFGIAKLYGGASVTAEGGVLGTADYMAPEQAEGQPPTSRCDLYALGSVLYALLTGKPPFAGRSIVEVIAALRDEEPAPVRRLAPDVPEEFENIIQQLLEKDPQKRIPTARAVANRLKAMEHALSLETRVLEPLDDEDDDEYRLAAAEAPTVVSSPDQASGRTDLGTQSAKKTGAGSDSGRGTQANRPGAALNELLPVTRFTTVSEEELRGRRESEETPLWQWLLMGGLAAAAVVLIAALVYYASRPPSADRLYTAVQGAAEAGRPEELAAVENQLTRFLELYSNDPRAVEVKELQEELHRYRVGRRFELRARRGDSGEGLTPAQRAYLQAVQLAASDPAAALARFEAIVAVFGGPPDAALTDAQQRARRECLELAREQIATLRPLVERMIAEQLAAASRELERADRIAATDRAAAQAIWRGLITLYGDQPWAEQLVAEARSRLGEPPQAGRE